jgi:lipoate-protein ligase A
MRAQGPAAPWRLLVTEPLDGALNMAIDEALLEGRIAGTSPPTVRFFAWAPPAVSLGYGQAVETAVDRAALARLGVALVRRPTGGSAILHEGADREVTYGVVGRAGDVPGGDDVLETYRVIGRGLAAGLARLGVVATLAPPLPARARGPVPAFCFVRTGAHEIAVGGRKLVGSAQRRQRGAFLQHGSILLAADAGRLRAVFAADPDPLAGMTTLTLVLGRGVTFDEVVAAVAPALADALGAALQPGGLSAEETTRVEALVASKYATAAWTLEGRAPAATPAVAGLAG